MDMYSSKLFLEFLSWKLLFFLVIEPQYQNDTTNAHVAELRNNWMKNVAITFANFSQDGIMKRREEKRKDEKQKKRGREREPKAEERRTRRRKKKSSKELLLS